MTKEKLKEKIDELIELNGVPYAYFISWNPHENHITNSHGKYSELESVIDEMEKAVTCIQGELPFQTLIIYFNSICDVFRRDPYWDCTDEPSEWSHTICGVPYVNMDGDWLYLNGSPETVYMNLEE